MNMDTGRGTASGILVNYSKVTEISQALKQSIPDLGLKGMYDPAQSSCAAIRHSKYSLLPHMVLPVTTLLL